MTTKHFSGPLAADLTDFVATLEASASANKATLTQLRALDRLTTQSPLPAGTIDEALAMIDVDEPPKVGELPSRVNNTH